MLVEGVRLMAVGMGTVFGFLGLLVMTMYAQAAFFRANAAMFPEPEPERASLPEPSDDGAEIAAIVAAIAAPPSQEQWMTTKRVSVMNTGFRDGFQSCFGARVFTKDFLPAVEAAREAGFTHFEAGGGARYQALYLYCGEDAFDMMDAFRETAGPGCQSADAGSRCQCRGARVVQSSDIIRPACAQLFKKHGITTIRNFDALNDVNNLILQRTSALWTRVSSIEVVRHAHGTAAGRRGAVPGRRPRDPGSLRRLLRDPSLRQILDAEIPFDSRLLQRRVRHGGTEPKVHDTIKRARAGCCPSDDFYLHFHTHETAGISVSANLQGCAWTPAPMRIDLSAWPLASGRHLPSQTFWSPCGMPCAASDYSIWMPRHRQKVLGKRKRYSKNA